MRSHRQQPTKLPHPWDSPGKNTGVGCHFLLQCMKVKSQSAVAQLCPTLSDLDCSLPGSSIHGIFHARILEWGAIAFSRETSKFIIGSMNSFVVVQSLSCDQLFVTPWTAASQASLSFTISQSLLKLMATELVMLSKQLVLCHPLLLHSIFPSIRVFSNELAFCIRWPNIGASAST